ncbi:CobW/HypB/UreG, nucleotide-binding domain-containing protein [Mariannaea sp. PMI_226]|nr:CobW/HypB/UreG, nucleotide-binding domain-containing protein [Mariannaea sp. PMI_226]
MNAQGIPALSTKTLPVTLLSGFLGAGKTTLLQHILRTDHGLRIAVIVNDIGAINVDASLIRKTHTLTKTNEKVIALQNGCICCTLRGDLLEELVRIAQLQTFDYIIIESSGISEPEQVAETFDSRLAQQMDIMASADGAPGLDEGIRDVLQRLKEAGGLETFARLDTTVTVVDAFTMMHDFDTGDLLSSRREDVTVEDERTVSDLMVDQIEFADVIILNKIDMVSPEQKKCLISLIKQLNRRAKLLESSYGKVDVGEIVNTRLFNLEVAQSGYGWLQDLHEMTVRQVNGKNVVTPKPETEECNVRSFIYSRHRPFHPRRLWSLVYDKFILQLEHPDDDVDNERGEAELDGDFEMIENDGDDDDDDDDGGEPEDLFTPPNEVILENKRKDPIFGRLFRSKGEFFLATRPHRAGDWSQAGAMLTMEGGRAWFCTLPREEYFTGDPEVDRLVWHDIKRGGEWGDRRQEIVFIGEGLDHKALETMLDECLLTEEEFVEWEETMRNGQMCDEEKREALKELFEDGFPDWQGDDDYDDDVEDEEDHKGHSH